MWNVLTWPDFQEQLSVDLYESKPFSHCVSFAFQEFRNWPGGKIIPFLLNSDIKGSELRGALPLCFLKNKFSKI